MSRKRFIQTLQALLTMVDPNNPSSITCVKNALQSILSLAQESKKVDALTLRIMMEALDYIDDLILHREDFAGKPGDYPGNTAKQNRLMHILMPGC